MRAMLDVAIRAWEARTAERVWLKTTRLGRELGREASQARASIDEQPISELHEGGGDLDYGGAQQYDEEGWEDEEDEGE